MFVNLHEGRPNQFRLVVCPGKCLRWTALDPAQATCLRPLQFDQLASAAAEHIAVNVLGVDPGNYDPV